MIVILTLLQSLPLKLSVFQPANSCGMDNYMNAEYVQSIFGLANSAQQGLGKDDNSLITRVITALKTLNMFHINSTNTQLYSYSL